LLILAETEAEIAEDTRIEALELEMVIQQQYNAIQGTCCLIIIIIIIIIIGNAVEFHVSANLLLVTHE